MFKVLSTTESNTYGQNQRTDETQAMYLCSEAQNSPIRSHSPPQGVLTITIYQYMVFTAYFLTYM